jgi:hypothetical protein
MLTLSKIAKLAHVSVSTSKVLITLGIGNAKVVKMIIPVIVLNVAMIIIK